MIYNNVNTLNSGANVSVCPNPAHDYIVITNNESQISNKTIEILDITGKEINVVCHSEQSEESISIDISNLKAGIYFIKAGNSVAKFIKE
jgi:hypothetical protein